MKMTKQTQMLVGVGVLALAGYYLWNQSKKKQTFIPKRGMNRGMGMNKAQALSKYSEAFGRPVIADKSLTTIPSNQYTVSVDPDKLNTYCAKGARYVGTNNGIGVYAKSDGQFFGCKEGEIKTLAEAKVF